MFTGIVREVGRVARIDPSGKGRRVAIEAPRTCPDLALGASVSVDGCCLTVTRLDHGTFEADLVAETLGRTIWKWRSAGDPVNLERSVRAGEPIDGHLVQGHVDGVGIVRAVTREPLAWTVAIEPPPALLPLLAEKGSVAVNGVSLTVAGVEAETFTVALIPTTLSETNLRDLAPGGRVNLEADVLARYAARLLERRQG